MSQRRALLESLQRATVARGQLAAFSTNLRSMKAALLSDRITRLDAVKMPDARIFQIAPLAAIVWGAPWLPGPARLAPCFTATDMLPVSTLQAFQRRSGIACGDVFAPESPGAIRREKASPPTPQRGTGGSCCSRNCGKSAKVQICKSPTAILRPSAAVRGGKANRALCP